MPSATVMSTPISRTVVALHMLALIYRMGSVTTAHVCQCTGCTSYTIGKVIAVLKEIGAVKRNRGGCAIITLNQNFDFTRLSVFTLSQHLNDALFYLPMADLNFASPLALTLRKYLKPIEDQTTRMVRSLLSSYYVSDVIGIKDNNNETDNNR